MRLLSSANRVIRYFLPDYDLNVEKRLKAVLRAANFFVSLGVFSSVIEYKLRTSYYFSENWFVLANMTRFLREQGLFAAIGLTTVWAYSNFWANTEKEIEVMASMFSPSRTPQRWERVRSRRQLYWLTAMWLVVAVILFWTVDEPRYFSIALMAYAVLNIGGIIAYRRETLTSLADPRYSPQLEDEHRDFILERREIQSIYLNKPHHSKEALLLAGACIAFISTFVVRPGFYGHYAVPIMILICFMLLNEYIVRRWRAQRNKALTRVDVAQSTSDRLRLHE